MAAHPDATTARTPIGKVLGIALALVGVVAVIVLAFAWPSVTAEPKDLPVAISGPAEAISAAGMRCASCNWMHASMVGWLTMPHGNGL